MKKSLRLLIILLVSVLALTTMTGCTLNYNKYVGVTEAVINDDGELVITYDDGTTSNLGKVVGKDGKDGINGGVGNGGDSITIVGGEDNTALATSLGLTSSVNVIASFDKGSGTSLESYASAGAGVIYKLDKSTGDAYIITNYHVVYDSSSNTGIAKELTVYLYGMEWSNYGITAEYIGGSMTYDIAVLRIKDSDALKSGAYTEAKIANSETICVGDTAIAIGNPDSMGISASVGIISVDSEYITMLGADGVTDVTFRVMRIDTAVNPGNSGGGLYNANGELIGIVNAKRIDNTLENIGYAIPSNIAVRVADSLIYYCADKTATTMKKPLMGVTIEMSGSSMVIDEETARVSIKETITVKEVSAGSAADGVLEVGDIFVNAYYGDISFEVTRQYQIIDLMLLVRAGETVSYDVIRNGETVRVDVLITSSCLSAVS